MERFHQRKYLPHVVGRRLSWVVVAVAVLFSGAVLGAGIEPDTLENSSANLPTDAESVRAAAAVDALVESDTGLALVVLDREGGSLTRADRGAVESLAGTLGDLAAPGGRVFPVVADDGGAAFVGVPLRADLPEEERYDEVDRLREALASADLPDGLRAQVTGGPAFEADLSQVFDGADVRLLAATAAVVALLLLVTYRSPWLWLVPLLTVAVGDQVAAGLVAAASRVLPFSTDGASTGITSVLVFGAGTNYALLLIARYREELRRTEDRYDAMRHAVDRAGPAILASAGTVVLALLCLGLADNPTSRNIGFGGAIGIATAVVYALVVLPAAMTVFGRGLFWPFVPRLGQDDPSRTGLWAAVGRRVTGRPAVVAVAGAAGLVVLALPLTGLSVGLSQTDQFLDEPESVSGQRTLAEHFPAGASQPTTVVVPADRAGVVRRAVQSVDGVRSVEPASDVRRGADEAVLDVVLTADPASEAAFDAVEGVRAAADEAVRADGGAGEALVGGPDAEALDAADAATRDQWLIIPLILVVVLVVLLVLLRSVVAAVVLVLTVVATYAASLGASWFAFGTVLDYPALDVSVPLLSFLFLVALGVDYNIFLTTRAKEEAEQEGATPREAISVALAVTGGVITSAGILLAAVFTVLGVLPLVILAQIGVIVGFGVLLDTLLVRSVLVPALVTLLGRWFWWPGRLSRPDVAVPDAERPAGLGTRSGTPAGG